MTQNIREGFPKIKATSKGDETAYEYRKRALDYHNTTLKEIEEEIGDENEKAEFGSTNHEVYIQVGINSERKRIKQLIHQKLIK